LKLRYRGYRKPCLNGVDLRLEPGTGFALTGRSGSGKSTLLKALNGLIPWLIPARVDGKISLGGDLLDDLDPGQRAHLIGSCLDRPEAQLFLLTVRAEIEAALRLYREKDWPDELISRMELDSLLDRRILELSSGERQRVALTVTLCAGSRPMLLDEPTAHLDRRSVQALGDILRERLRNGATFVAAEHSPWRLDSVFSGRVDMRKGRLQSLDFEAMPIIQSPRHEPGERWLLRAEGLEAEIGGRKIFSDVGLEIREGEIILLSGDNGAGKSTLARMLTAGRRPRKGSRDLRSARPPLLIQPAAALQLFASSVEGELSGPGQSREEISRVLRRHRLEACAARAPWSLSHGEQQRLVHAVFDMLQPEILVIDEPAQGLDAEDLVEFMKLIRRRASKGRAYLIISHRQELAAGAHRHLVLHSRGLEEVPA